MNDANDEKTIGGIPIMSEEIAFRDDQMLACPKCARRNPPNRLKCVYCGDQLEIASDADGIKLSMRKLEPWEKGFNVILESADAARAEEIAAVVKLSPETVRQMIGSGLRLPVARVESDREAALLCESLSGAGAGCRTVSDESFAPDTSPRRLRAIGFDGSDIEFRLFNEEETVRASRDSIVAIITGAVFERSVEATEKRKKGQTKMLDSTETASDEPLVDIYLDGDPVGFRISTAGFDFSCLGSEKSMLARTNLTRLAEKLASESGVTVNRGYLRVRELLGAVWEIDSRRDSLGMSRSSFGRFDLKSVSSSSNLRQFNRFSRLQIL